MDTAGQNAATTEKLVKSTSEALQEVRDTIEMLEKVLEELGKARQCLKSGQGKRILLYGSCVMQ